MLRDRDRRKLKPWFPYLKLFITALFKIQPCSAKVIYRGVKADLHSKYHRDASTATDIGSDKKNEETYSSEFQKNTVAAAASTNTVNTGINSITKKISAVKTSAPATKVIPNIPVDARWVQNGMTVAGGHGWGHATNQLKYPYGLFVDDDQTMVIADYDNHRIIQWKMDDTNGQVVAGGNGRGNRLDQLNNPTDVLIDKETDSLIVCDLGNRRVVRWSRRSGTTQREILLDNIACRGLAMDDQRYLYISDYDKDEVRRYQIGDKNGTIVAGGNGTGDSLNQLHEPTYIFVDQQQNIYVSEYENHRVMKWNKGAKEGIVVAGGQGEGNALTQLWYPNGLFVDTLGTLYVADSGNHRLMCWRKGAKQGTVIVGGNGKGAGANQFNGLQDFLNCLRRPISAGYCLTSSLTSRNSNSCVVRATTANCRTRHSYINKTNNQTNENVRGGYFGLSSEEIRILRTIKEVNRQHDGFVRIFPTYDTYEFFSSFFEQRTATFNSQQNSSKIRRTTVPRSKHPSSAFNYGHQSGQNLTAKTNGCNLDEALERYRTYERRLIDIVPPQTTTTTNENSQKINDKSSKSQMLLKQLNKIHQNHYIFIDQHQNV
ncbi:unnamed protein product [Rotaria sordida]|uniref:Uncharacterized protein n=1 Tax=Rotaria sordida TaxID=392033 RepID=A0A814HM60_9BILA|nr:unnamed protein product [Rotaria sordida]